MEEFTFDTKLIKPIQIIGKNQSFYIHNNFYIVEPIDYRHGTNLSYIKINNCVFSIRRFYNFDGRIHVVVYCYDVVKKELFRNKYYTSISDLSFYRFCLIRYDGGYDKGINYASTTFINIELQQFLDKNKEKFNIGGKQGADNCEESKSLEKTDKYLYERIFSDNENYISKHFFFTQLNDIFAHVETYTNYIDHVLKIINGIKENIKDDIIRGLLSNLFCLMHKKNINKDLVSETSRTEFFIKLKEVLEELFLIYFKISKNTSKYIYSKNIIIGDKNINLIIFSVECYSECTKTYYIIYYAKYTLDKCDYKNIIHIIPKVNKITKYGLDERYVSAGIFINKIFDYKIQAPITIVDVGDRGKITEKTPYIFIGYFTNYSFLP